MAAEFIIALDQGTTSSRAMLYDSSGRALHVAQKELTQYYPQSGWVEHNPSEIWGTQSGVFWEVLALAGVRPGQIKAIGIANQRETTVVWDRTTGKPVYNAIVWQDRRTASMCETLIEQGMGHYIRQNTGLVIDAYFSATKVKWLLDHVEGARERAKRGELLFGTIDAWLIWNLTRGAVHATDYSNASRTMMFNIHHLDWDDHILKTLDIPREMLPQVKDSSSVFGYTDDETMGGANIPIAGAAGDQQAALFGQTCLHPGMMKNTYGTGCFLLMNTGKQPVISEHGILTTIGWRMHGETVYALEGSIFIAGAVIQWLRDNLKLLDSAPDSEYFANKAGDSGDVFFVPAFQGLGAPYWDMYARGAIIGLTQKVGKAELVRAALESMGYQTRDVVEAMQKDANLPLAALRVDGGACVNDVLMQFQADILNTRVERPEDTETTARGAAYLAGLAMNFWKKETLQEKQHHYEVFYPQMNDADRERKYYGWQDAVKRTMGWVAQK